MCDLTDAFHLSQPTISHHLKVLHETGLLARQHARHLGCYRCARRRWPAWRALIAGAGAAGEQPGHGGGTTRSGRADTVAFAVGGYITAAYWVTSSTSFANPAVTLARTLSDSIAGIAPGSVAMFVLMQIIGGALGHGLIRALHPSPRAARGRPDRIPPRHPIRRQP